MLNKESVKIILLKDIKPSPLNPRKYINKDSISELAESLNSVGMIQPITVRPIPGVDEYEIVIGERRYRAAMELNWESIFCIVNTITDEDALKIMITENLQREDITPMEEMRSYQALIEQGYNMEGIVSMTGKSSSYIRGRLKLADLIPRFTEPLNAGVIPLSVILEICKLPMESQEDLYDHHNFAYWNGPHYTCPSLKNIKSVIEKNFSFKLDKATFNIDDVTIDPEMGACTTCQYNSTNEGSLFPGDQAGRCMLISCFENKKKTSFDMQLKRVIEEEPEMLIGYNKYSWIGSDGEALVADLKKQKVAIINEGFEIIEPPSVPQEVDPEDFEDEEDYQKAKAKYAKQMEAFTKKSETYKKQVESGKTTKMFIVAGDNAGSVVMVKKIGSKGSDDNEAPGTRKKEDVATRIKDLKGKDLRNEEIRMEHTLTDINKFFRESNYDEDSVTPFTKTEWIALFIIMQHAMTPDSFRKTYYKATAKYNRHDDMLNYLTAEGFVTVMENGVAEAKLAPDAIILMRSFIREELLDTTHPRGNEGSVKIIFELVEEKYPEDFARICKVHQDVYDKRKAGIEKRINELKPAKPVVKADPKPSEKKAAKKKKDQSNEG